jgi:hypothetical protein
MKCTALALSPGIREAKGDFVKKLILTGLALTQAFGQTQIDLGRQAKNVDFSNLPFVRPFRTGASLPATCVTGEMFFLTTAAAGGNTYGCSTTNSWSLEGQGSSGTVISTPAAPAGLQVTWTSGTTLQIGSACSVSAPCKVRLGAVVYSFTAPATATVQSGSGMTYIYVDGAGALTVGSSSATTPQVSCSGCQTQSPITQFPVDSIPLATWNATSGVWDSTGTDQRATLSGGRTFTAGPNIQITESGDNVTIAAITSSSQVGGSGTPLTAYSPIDMTQFNRTIIFADYGWQPYAPFGNSRYCIGAGARSGAPGEATGPLWFGNGNPCALYYPAGGAVHPFSDFLSGTAPLAYTLVARFAGGNAGTLGPGNLYAGWSSASDGTVSNYVGIRYLAASNVWQCIITSNGADIAANTIAAQPDAAFHTFIVTNGTTPNTVSCSIDGSSVTSSATIPPNSWYSILGTDGATATTYFTALEERIQILGISR